MLALRKEGMGVILDSELPYLLAIDDNILSTGMKLYHIKVHPTSGAAKVYFSPESCILLRKHETLHKCSLVHIDH